MLIEIHACAQSAGQGGNRRSGCALIMVARADDGRVLTRKMMFPLGDSTLNLAGLQAVRLAASALRPWVGARALPVSVFTDSQYALEMLAKDGSRYRADPKANAEAVAALRAAAERLPGLSLERRKMADGIAGECAVLARAAASAQAVSDSGTKEFADGKEAGL